MRIAFLCTPNTENAWTPEMVHTGVGGSEEATIHLAELLGRRGHRVSVNMPGAQGRTFGSVSYDDYTALRGEDIDVAVMWRIPELAELSVDYGFPPDFILRARRSYLRLHDAMPADRVLKNARCYHKVIVLSDTHRRLYPQLTDDRILLSANGIDPEQFDSDEGTGTERDPYLMVYGSDYERGLATLLTRWPAIKDAVPQARLNVFYGWQTVEALFPERAETLHRELDPLLLQPGVTHLGRLNHRDVATQYLRAGVWAYPGRFLEVSCISAMKAQAGGAIPVVTPTGALREVVRFGFLTRRGYDETSPADESTLDDEWLNGLISILRSPEEQARIRREMIPASKARFAWSTVADQWEHEFAESLASPLVPVTAHPTICLNMIVKNEAHVIRECLDSVAPYICSWVIVDTGSDDGTQDVIRNHMVRLGIPGELHERPFRDFGHNRTEALALARGRADYLWIIDADDILVGAPDFTELSADLYWLRYRGGSEIYWSPQILRDGIGWSYVGVIHEAVASDRPYTDARLGGEYHVEYRCLGDRGRDPQKRYERDRDLLLADLERDPNNGHSISQLARAYFLMNDFVHARRWYERRVEVGGSEQDVYVAMFQIAESMGKLGTPWPEVQDAYLKAWEFRQTRAEPLYAIARKYLEDKRYGLGYQFARLAAEIPVPEQDTIVRADVYAWRADDDTAACAYFIGKHREAFTLWRGLLARPALPDGERPRIAANRDACAPAMIEAAGVYPEAAVRSLVARSGDAGVVVSLVAGPNRLNAEHTLNSFLNCCTDVARAGRFLVIDAGLSAADRVILQQRYGFLEFGCAAPGGRLAQIRAQIDERLWLHLGAGWRFFAPENLITRLGAMLQAEQQVFQVGVNVSDATQLTRACAAEQAVRRAPDAGRYVLTDAVAHGPAMFDTARLDLAGGIEPSGASGLRTASLDEVLCIATPRIP